MSPFILAYTQSPHEPWQFLDTYVSLDELLPVDASETQKKKGCSGAQLSSYLGLDIINSIGGGDHVTMTGHVRAGMGYRN